MVCNIFFQIRKMLLAAFDRTIFFDNMSTAASFACTLAQSSPLCRLMFFSKHTRNVLSSSSRCLDDNSFFIYS
jgi:hypothetical protein